MWFAQYLHTIVLIMKLKLTSNHEERTRFIASQIGANLKGGECIELIADVGGGKTTFVRGLVKGAGSKSHVSSPTFSISKLYKANKFDIVHFDFYRLEEVDLIEYEVEEAVLDDSTVIVVEWSEAIRHVLPEDRLQLTIQAPDENKRILSFSAPDKLRYLTKDCLIT